MRRLWQGNYNNQYKARPCMDANGTFEDYSKTIQKLFNNLKTPGGDAPGTVTWK